jgi:hypothetical protein
MISAVNNSKNNKDLKDRLYRIMMTNTIKCHPTSTPIKKPWHDQISPKVILQKGV